MIRRLVMENWRNYANLDIALGVGTTFVVAPNGVGKTSLIEAVRYGLYGTIDSPETAVQMGQPNAQVRIELVLLSKRVAEIARKLPSELKPRQAFPAPTVRVDGSALSPEQFRAPLTSEYAASESFLARLTIPPRDSSDGPASMGLEEHLGHYFGIEGLRALQTRLTEELKACESAARKLKR